MKEVKRDIGLEYVIFLIAGEPNNQQIKILSDASDFFYGIAIFKDAFDLNAVGASKLCNLLGDLLDSLGLFLVGMWMNDRKRAQGCLELAGNIDRDGYNCGRVFFFPNGDQNFGEGA